MIDMMGAPRDDPLTESTRGPAPSVAASTMTTSAGSDFRIVPSLPERVSLYIGASRQAPLDA